MGANIGSQGSTGGDAVERAGHGRRTDLDHGREASGAPLCAVEAGERASEGPVEDEGLRPHLLLVDDDALMLRALGNALRQHGFATTAAADAGEAFARMAEHPPDLVVLDVVMPVIDGRQLSRLIRDRYGIPILMVTGLNEVADRVAGLESGADDYLTKPFAIEELVARVRALLRRGSSKPSAARVLSFSDLVLDTHRWEVTRAGRPIALTSKEFRILDVLMREPRRVFSREQILAAAWENDGLIESNVVDVHIATLRRKIEEGGASRLIQTIRGVGYSLRE